MKGRVDEPYIVPKAKILILTDMLFHDEPYIEREQAKDLSVPGWQWCHYIFHFHVRKFLEIWESEWDKCLDVIDECIKVKVHSPG